MRSVAGYREAKKPRSRFVTRAGVHCAGGAVGDRVQVDAFRQGLDQPAVLPLLRVAGLLQHLCAMPTGSI